MLNVNFMFQQKDIKQMITKWWMLQKRKYRFFKTRGQKSLKWHDIKLRPDVHSEKRIG